MNDLIDILLEDPSLMTIDDALAASEDQPVEVSTERMQPYYMAAELLCEHVLPSVSKDPDQFVSATAQLAEEVLGTCIDSWDLIYAPNLDETPDLDAEFINLCMKTLGTLMYTLDWFIHHASHRVGVHLIGDEQNGAYAACYTALARWLTNDEQLQQMREAAGKPDKGFAINFDGNIINLN